MAAADEPGASADRGVACAKAHDEEPSRDGTRRTPSSNLTDWIRIDTQTPRRNEGSRRAEVLQSECRSFPGRLIRRSEMRTWITAQGWRRRARS